MTSRAIREFWDSYRTLPDSTKKAARRAHEKFLQSPAHPSLQLHRLRRDPRLWSVRVSSDYRAVARRYENDVWVWIWIGTHAAFDARFRM